MDAKAEIVYKYRELKSRIETLEKVQSDMKTELVRLMKLDNLEEFEAGEFKVKLVEKKKFKFDVKAIFDKVPSIIEKLTIKNADFNKILVGREAELGPLRRIIDTSEVVDIRVKK